MLILFVKGMVSACFVLLILWTRNAHHIRKNGKDIYTPIWPIKLLLILGPLFLMSLLPFGAFKSPDGTSLTATESMIYLSAMLCLALPCWYLSLYHIATDDKAIYYAAFFQTTIPFEQVTRIAEKGRGMRSANVYSNGHLPIYVSGMLIDYKHLMDSIRARCPQAQTG